MKKYFWSGFVLLLPVVITLAIVNFTLGVLTNPFMNLFSSLLVQFGLDKSYLQLASSFLILLFLFFLTILLGIFARWYLVRKCMTFAEQLILKIPFVNKVYKASQDVIHTVFANNTPSFKQVVLVPFPTPEVHSLGLLIRECPDACQQAFVDAGQDSEEMMSVFVPTTPNPTTGFILMFKKKDVKPTTLSIEDALKYTISCGVIHPKSSTLSKIIQESEAK